jgi:predicted RNase H-like HicB family nuclease
VVEVTTYTVVAKRSDHWWAVSVPELKGVHSQARRLDQVESMAREAIALFLDIPPESFAITVEPEIPREVSHALAERQAAKDAEKRAEAATVSAVGYLLSAGFTVRDAGRLLGLSAQRVSQISGSGDHAQAS